MAKTRNTATLARLNQLLEKGPTSIYELMRALKAPAYVVAKLLLQRIETGRARPVSGARKVKSGAATPAGQR